MTFERGTQAEAHCERNLNRQLWSIRRKISHRCLRNFQFSRIARWLFAFVFKDLCTENRGKLPRKKLRQRARTPVFLVYFLQKAKANNQSVNTEIPWTAMRYFSSIKILHSWRLRFLSQLASACLSRSEKSFPAKLSNETSFNIDSILICTRLLVNQNAPC